MNVPVYAYVLIIVRWKLQNNSATGVRVLARLIDPLIAKNESNRELIRPIRSSPLLAQPCQLGLSSGRCCCYCLLNGLLHNCRLPAAKCQLILPFLIEHRSPKGRFSILVACTHSDTLVSTGYSLSNNGTHNSRTLVQTMMRQVW